MSASATAPKPITNEGRRAGSAHALLKRLPVLAELEFKGGGVGAAGGMDIRWNLLSVMMTPRGARRHGIDWGSSRGLMRITADPPDGKTIVLKLKYGTTR